MGKSVGLCGMLAAVTLAACAPPLPFMMRGPHVEIAQPFDATQAEAALHPGSATVSGNAFMRQRGGGVVTCAGQSVVLTPATPYATARASAKFGVGGNGFRSADVPPVRFTPDEPAFAEMARKTRCDSSGRFAFDLVADGVYFITTEVTWFAGSAAQGGELMKRVIVTDGKSRDVVITP